MKYLILFIIGVGLLLPVLDAYGAYLFDGGTSSMTTVQATQNSTFSEGPITITAWVKMNNLTERHDFIGMPATSKEVNYGLRNIGTKNGGFGEGHLLFHYRGTTGFNDFQSLAPVFTVGEWTHVAVSYTFADNTTAKLYKNGIEISGNWSLGKSNGWWGDDPPQTITSTVNIGLFTGPNKTATQQNYCNCTLSDIAVWNSTLSTAKIKKLADQTSFVGQIDPEHLIQYYPLNAEDTTNDAERYNSYFDRNNVNLVSGINGFIPSGMTSDTTIASAYSFENFDKTMITIGAVGTSDHAIREPGNIIYDPSDTLRPYKFYYSGTFSGFSNPQIHMAYTNDLLTGTWIKEGLIIPQADIGIWTEDPSVILDEDGNYHMWTESNSIPTDIAHLTSLDGINWTLENAQAITSTPGTYDARCAQSPTAYKNETHYHIFYESSNKVSGGACGGGQISLATSTDAITWTKSSKNPVMLNNTGRWDNRVIVPDDIQRIDGKLYMVYHAHPDNVVDGSWPLSGLAESEDGGYSWERSLRPVSSATSGNRTEQWQFYGSETNKLIGWHYNEPSSATSDSSFNVYNLYGSLDQREYDFTNGALSSLLDPDVTQKKILGDSSISPLKQTRAGVLPNDVICKIGYDLIIKSNTTEPACVSSSTALKLVSRGWGVWP